LWPVLEELYSMEMLYVKIPSAKTLSVLEELYSMEINME